MAKSKPDRFRIRDVLYGARSDTLQLSPTTGQVLMKPYMPSKLTGVVTVRGGRVDSAYRWCRDEGLVADGKITEAGTAWLAENFPPDPDMEVRRIS